MKKILFSLLILFNMPSFSNDGIIIVLNASLLKSPQEGATVLQNVRKGSRIYIPASLDLKKALPEFIQTFDRAGNVAFIRSHHVKIITNDEQEQQWPSSMGEYDPTDYRLEEPIIASYPFLYHEYGRVSFDLSMGTNPLAPYNYGNQLSGQNYAYEKGIRFQATKRFSSDNSNRFFLGAIGRIAIAANTFSFLDGSNSTESRSVIRLGPFVSYDAYRNSFFRFSTGLGLTVNYHRSSISLRDRIGNGDQQFFSGFSISPVASLSLVRDNIIPGLDLTLGSDYYLQLPYSQAVAIQSSSPVYWNSAKIQSSTHSQVSFFIGVQTKY
jgi:hypothetical protein